LPPGRRAGLLDVIIAILSGAVSLYVLALLAFILCLFALAVLGEIWSHRVTLAVVIAFTGLLAGVIALRRLLAEVSWKRKPCEHRVRGAAADPYLCPQCSEVRRQRLRRDFEGAEQQRAKAREEEAARRRELAIKKRELLEKTKSLTALQKLDPEQFQQLVWGAYRRAGYAVQETSFSRDGGADGFLVKEPNRLVLQCKRYKGDVGEPVVRDLFGTARHHNADGAILVTTGRISQPARSFARGKNITLIDGEALLSLLKEADLSEDMIPDELAADAADRHPAILRRWDSFHPSAPRAIIPGKQGKLDEAEAECREVIRLDPTDARAHDNLGDILRKQGKLDAAVAEYREAIRLDPTDASPHGGLATILGKQGKLNEAEAACREAIRLDPKFAWAHGILAITLRKQGKLDEAAAEDREASRLRSEPEKR